MPQADATVTAAAPATGQRTAPPPETRISPWRFLQFAGGFWRGESARTAWTWSILAAILLLATLGVSIGMNHWNRWFFDSLEKKQSGVLLTALLVFVGLIALGAVLAAAMVKCRMTLQVSWRAWITRQLTGRWLTDQRYYRLAITDDKGINPEYRLAEDVRLASEPVVDFVIGFVNAVLAAVAFVSILFLVGGSITVPIPGNPIVVPGYIAIAAVVYAVVVSSITMALGNPLVGKVEAKNEAEAQFRYELTRVRENAESIALVKGDEDERKRLSSTFERTVASWKDVITQNVRLTWLFNANTFFAPVVPLLLAAPKYLAGEMTLGQVMQLAAAFVTVLGALNWFTDNYVRLAEWSASARRVDELYVAMELVSVDDSLRKVGPIVIENSTDEALHLENVSIVHRDGRVMIADAAMKIEPGERVLLGGESGTGKSTLIRAIAGLWPWGEGRIRLPHKAKVAFVPQRAYIPLGRLRDVLAYPGDGNALSDEKARSALQQAGLGHLAEKLDATERWEQIFSGGERQRLAFARLLINRPSVIVMDEATGQLDPDTELRLLTLLFSELPESTVVSVGHREGLEQLHSRKLTLMRHHTGARITQIRARREKKKRWQKLKSAAGNLKGRLLRRGKRGNGAVAGADAGPAAGSPAPGQVTGTPAGGEPGRPV